MILAAGISPTYSFQFGKVTGNVSCPVTDAYGKNFTAPARTGNYSRGEATLWVFLYYNSSAVTESVIAALGSTAYFLGTESGASCMGTLALPRIPSGFIDSTTAAADADRDAGSFLHAHAPANAVYFLIDHTTIGPEWGGVYSNCSYNPATNTTRGGTKGDVYLAELNGLSGTVISSEDLAGDAKRTALAGSVHVGPPSYALGMPEFEASGSGANWNTDLTLFPTSGLTSGMFGFRLVNAVDDVTQTPATVPTACAYGALASDCVAGTGGYAVVVGFSGTVRATYGNGTPGWGDLAPTTVSLALTRADTLVIVSNTQIAGNGETLAAFPTGANPVSGAAHL